MLKVGCRGYRMLGVTGLVGAYYIGARTQPQLIGFKNWVSLISDLGLQTMEGDKYAETGR